MKNFIVLFLGMLLLAGPFPRLQAQSQIEMNETAREDFEKADAELNKVYKKVMAGLDDEGKKKLQVSQRAWIVFRDAEAGYVADAERGGSIVPLVYATTQTELTRARTKRFREQL